MDDATRHAPSHASGVRLDRADRALSAGLALGAMGVLAVAAWLHPSHDGLGTHTQLGLASCQWISDLNTPCPTCGMTTSFASAAHGDFAGAFRAQPFGALLALATSAVFWLGLHAAATGGRAGAAVARIVLRPGFLWPMGAAFLAAWGYKVVTWQG